MALMLDGAVESAHMSHPDFRAHGRIFATLRDGETLGMLSLPPEEQQRLVAEFPQVFVPENGAWGLQGATRVLLRKAEAEVVGGAMTLAWQHAAKRANRSKKPGGAGRSSKSRR
jgi:hypothetical protein